MFVPFLILFLLFAFPPTRKLVGFFLNKKFQKMAKNGHVYYRSYHFKTGNFQNPVKDVTPQSDNVIDVTPISESNLRNTSNNESTAR